MTGLDVVRFVPAAELQKHRRRGFGRRIEIGRHEAEAREQDTPDDVEMRRPVNPRGREKEVMQRIYGRLLQGHREVLGELRQLTGSAALHMTDEDLAEWVKDKAIGATKREYHRLGLKPVTDLARVGRGR